MIFRVEINFRIMLLFVPKTKTIESFQLAHKKIPKRHIAIKYFIIYIPPINCLRDLMTFLSLFTKTQEYMF
jgi:hypothetical protein